MTYTPENSAVAAQLAAHYRIMGGWDNRQAIAQAIETNDSNALDRLCLGFGPKAMEIIDCLVKVTATHRNRGI